MKNNNKIDETNIACDMCIVLIEYPQNKSYETCT